MIGLALSIVCLYVYYQPIPLFGIDHAQCSIKRIQELMTEENLGKIPLDFETQSRDKLLFLLNGIYLSQLCQFSYHHCKYPLELSPVPGGHMGLYKHTMYIFLRPTHTVHDFLNDLCLFTREAAQGRIYSGPARLADRLVSYIKPMLVTDPKCDREAIERVVLSGISLGGSIATIAAESLHVDKEIDANVQLTVFCPYCTGDREYNRYVTKLLPVAWSVKNINDVISSAFSNRVGITILFDYDGDDRTSNHCEILDMLSKMGPGEKLDDKAFYFSDG